MAEATAELTAKVMAKGKATVMANSITKATAKGMIKAIDQRGGGHDDDNDNSNRSTVVLIIIWSAGPGAESNALFSLLRFPTLILVLVQIKTKWDKYFPLKVGNFLQGVGKLD
jgi:hypothetical protein